MTSEIKRELLAILACPKCRTAIKQDSDYLQCQNPECRLRYPIRNSIPIMLIEEAKVVKPLQTSWSPPIAPPPILSADPDRP